MSVESGHRDVLAVRVHEQLAAVPEVVDHGAAVPVEFNVGATSKHRLNAGRHSLGRL